MHACILRAAIARDRMRCRPVACSLGAARRLAARRCRPPSPPPLLLHLQESAFFQELKGSAPFFLMAGPNVIQSEEHCLKMCRQIKAVTGAPPASLLDRLSAAAGPLAQPQPTPTPCPLDSLH